VLLRVSDSSSCALAGPQPPPLPLPAVEPSRHLDSRDRRASDGEFAGRTLGKWTLGSTQETCETLGRELRFWFAEPAQVESCEVVMVDLLHSTDLDEFRAVLLAWYQRNCRDLPWRRTRDPYAIWLSEIMLQQTRVAAVIAHYKRFLKRFPTVHTLAAARESSVLAQWSGLGYYRRARNLHAAAKAIVREYGGAFPRTSTGLQALPGIGRYTAAAIASIAFGDPSAVVDGNVERVISRLAQSTVSRKRIWEITAQLLARERPGEFNQAMMELGAMVCLPAEPNCPECPVRSFCRTQGRHPARIRVKTTQQVKREIAYALERDRNSVRLVQRGASEPLMPGMWELPQVAVSRSCELLFSVRHSITVTDYTVRVLSSAGQLQGTWIKNSRLATLPLTGLTKKILRRAAIIK
jgi:A/G-specific adenine glycosylase